VSGVRAAVWTREALRYHLAFGPAICFCFAAGWFELTRAQSGHFIAWVYVGEWPLFGIVLCFMWWRVVTEGDNRRPSPPRPRSNRDIPDDDPGLQAWRAYLDELGHDDTSTDRAPGSG
jgi:hypothetical protein